MKTDTGVTHTGLGQLGLKHALTPSTYRAQQGFIITIIIIIIIIIKLWGYRNIRCNGIWAGRDSSDNDLDRQ